MSTIHAIFLDGVFRHCEPVELPDGSEVEFEPRIVQPNVNGNDALARVYQLLTKRFDSGECDVAASLSEDQR